MWKVPVTETVLCTMQLLGTLGRVNAQASSCEAIFWVANQSLTRVHVGIYFGPIRFPYTYPKTLTYTTYLHGPFRVVQQDSAVKVGFTYAPDGTLNRGPAKVVQVGCCLGTRNRLPSWGRCSYGWLSKLWSLFRSLL